MKTLTIAFFLIISNAYAIDSIIVKGDLLDRVQMNSRINKMILTQESVELELVNEFNEAPSCESGEYEITEIQEGKYSLKNIIKCDSYVDESRDVRMCPELFMPVCGELGSDDFSKELPELTTFSNMCDLYISKATFIKFGRCD